NKGFATITDDKTGKKKPLFKDLTIHESLLLQYKKEKNKILLLHGHQGDCLNDTCWWFGKFVVRNIWKCLQSKMGIPDPTSPARNYRKMLKTDDRFKQWIEKRKIPTIIGHTHKPVFPGEGETPYFNDGSCVHPRCITGIEVAEGRIQLVKWHVDVHTEEGWKKDLLYVNRRILAAPREMGEIFEE
ncbi:serine/threonine protein phosphatase, partial [bacterium]|nr:serine/threonine protein phosphatase [bacterium]